MEYYKYDNAGNYLGSVESDTQPENSSEFPPPKSLEGTAPWFDGNGWRLVVNYSGMGLERARQHALDDLSTVRFSYEGDYEYSVAERSSFDAQYEEALTVKSGGSPGLYITLLMEVHKLSAEELADKILSKREAFEQAQAQFNAKVQGVRLQIKNAKSVKELPTEVAIMKLRKPITVA